MSRIATTAKESARCRFRMRSLFYLLFLGLLGACQPAVYEPAAQEELIHSMVGNWMNENHQHVSLDSEGYLALFDGDRIGLRWLVLGESLYLTTTDQTLTESKTEHFTIIGRGNFRLRLRDESGKIVRWSRANRHVHTLQGIVNTEAWPKLPNQVPVLLKLSLADGQTWTAINLAVPNEEIPIKIHYLSDKIPKEAAQLEASILIGNVPVLQSGPQAISLTETPRLRVTGALAPAPAPPALYDTYWKIVRVNGEAAQTFPGQLEPHLVLRPDHRAYGGDGCNNFFAQWKLSGASLKLNNFGSTLQTCGQGMEQSSQIIQNFKTVDAWKMEGNTLVLQAKGKPVLRLEAADIKI